MKNKLSCWLKNINDHQSITELCIPGTHDAMTSTCDDTYYKTQHLSLEEQLGIGVRFFDLRITCNLVAAHREWISEITAKTIFDQLLQFLQKYPSEFIIVRIQNANEKKDDFEKYKPAIQTFISDYIEAIYRPKPNAANSYDWPCVGEARGKIIAIECSDPSLEVSSIEDKRWAYNWHENDNVLLQDNWNGPKVESKIKDIQSLLLPPAGSNKKLILNHISATNGDLGNPGAYADVINPVIENQLEKMEHNSGIGVLIYDFIHENLSIKTINTNTFLP